eukprot:1626894-Pleurochrysis_carterae.AAC.2
MTSSCSLENAIRTGAIKIALEWKERVNRGNLLESCTVSMRDKCARCQKSSFVSVTVSYKLRPPV